MSPELHIRALRQNAVSGVVKKAIKAISCRKVEIRKALGVSELSRFYAGIDARTIREGVAKRSLGDILGNLSEAEVSRISAAMKRGGEQTAVAEAIEIISGKLSMVPKKR